MNKKQQRRGILEWTLLAGAFVIGVRLAAPLMGDGPSNAFDVSGVADWTGQITGEPNLDSLIPLPSLASVTADSEAVLSNDVATLQSQLTEAYAKISDLEARILELQQQLSVALSGDLAQAEPLRFAEDGTPYASPINPAAQGFLCTYFQVGC